MPARIDVARNLGSEHGLEEVGHGGRIGAAQMHVVEAIVTHGLVLLSELSTASGHRATFARQFGAPWAATAVPP